MSGSGPAALRGLVTHHDAHLPGGHPARIRLHVVTAGFANSFGDKHPERSGGVVPAAESQDAVPPDDKPLVVLLHGFPEAWFAWQHQIPALAAAGYRVLAPDMRGFNLSDKPQGIHAYRIEHLAGDVAALIHWAGAERAVVVGHDWGANVAWHFAMRHPDMLDGLVIMNVPHPALMPKALSNPAQLLRSAYMFAFQVPKLAEAAFMAGDAAALRQTLARDSVREGAFTPEDIERYVAALKQPGAITGGMNYYRAAFRQAREQTRNLPPIAAPVLVIWGEQDRYLGKDLADPPRHLVPRARVVRLPDASHWVQNDRPERVNELLLAFLRDF